MAELGPRCCTGFSLVAASGSCFLVVACGLLIAAASLVVEHGLWSAGSVVLMHRLSCPFGRSYVGSSQIRDQTGVPCIGRWVLDHWTTRELHPINIYKVLITDQNYAKPLNSS